MDCREISSAVAIQLIVSSDQGSYGIVYDLKDGKIWKKFELKEEEITDEEDWTNIFKFLTKEFSPNIVKSIFLNIYDHISSDVVEVFEEWFPSIVEVGNEFGYKNLNWTPDYITIFTTELLLAKKKGKNYGIGDHIVFIKHSRNFNQIHLLKKQKIGWDVVDGKVIIISCLDLDSHFAKRFFQKNSITTNHVKDAFVKIDSNLNVGKTVLYLKKVFGLENLSLSFIDKPNAKYLEVSGEYLAKIYSGEDYFNDYDCFVGNICAQKFELQCGTTNVVLPGQFKRLPFTIKKKIKLTKCNQIKLLGSCDHFVEHYRSSMKVAFFTENVKIDSEVAVVTFHLNKLSECSIKIEKNNDEKTLIFSNVPLDEWEDDRPKFVFGPDYCSVNYYKDGLLWKLKDANGNEKIPFKISFDKEVYIGDAATEYGKQYLVNMDVDKLVDENYLKELAKTSKDVVVDDFGEIKLLVKTINGIRKTTPKKICDIFMHSLVELVSGKFDEPVDEVDVKFLEPCHVFFSKP